MYPGRQPTLTLLANTLYLVGTIYPITENWYKPTLASTFAAELEQDNFVPPNMVVHMGCLSVL